MKMTLFRRAHIPQAQALALKEYSEARAFLPLLPRVADLPNLTEFADAENGVALMEGDTLVGYLCGCRAYKDAFNTAATGTFSPLHAHAAARGDRAAIYQRLYRAAAELWVSKGITYHAIALYAHERDTQYALFEQNFGMRCIDALRAVTPIQAEPPAGFTFGELPLAEFPTLRPMRIALRRYLGCSPCFMVPSEDDLAQRLARVERGDRRTFIARDAVGDIEAYLDIADEGETFVTRAPQMANIKGAYCRPEYRGTGLFNALLNHVLCVLQEEGTTLLGVDYESVNTAALHYWRKHFTPYTVSVTRRVDECALWGR